MVDESEEQKVQEEQPNTSDVVKALELGLEDERKRSEEYLAQLKYARADVENLKKRFARQLEEATAFANESIIVELLSVVDELELAIKSATSCEGAESLVSGVEMTLKRLTKILEKEQVFPIKSLGETFDPEKHIAVARVEKEGVEACTIIEEVRRGYIMKGKVIRPSMVKISVPVSQMPKENEGEEQL